jgi:hypothetical protein
LILALIFDKNKNIIILKLNQSLYAKNKNKMKKIKVYSIREKVFDYILKRALIYIGILLSLFSVFWV